MHTVTVCSAVSIPTTVRRGRAIVCGTAGAVHGGDRLTDLRVRKLSGGALHRNVRSAATVTGVRTTKGDLVCRGVSGSRSPPLLTTVTTRVWGLLH